MPSRKTFMEQWSMPLMKCGLIGIVAFVGGGLIGSILTEQFGRLIYSITGGTTRYDYGLPFASMVRLRGLMYDPSIGSLGPKQIIRTSLENFAKNFGFWGITSVLLVEGVLLFYFAFSARARFTTYQNRDYAMVAFDS